MSRKTGFKAHVLLPAFSLASACLAGVEFTLHLRSRDFVRSIALEVVTKANAAETQAKVIALRDYLRSNVSFIGVPQEGRPLLRDSADVTLRTGKGWCGEVSRAFVCLAHELGIPAQRINLTGKELHTVAEAEIAPGKRVIVDSQNPPAFAGLVSLEEAITGGVFTGYYSVNLDRLRLTWLINRVRLEFGPIPYWLENPHLLKAFFWASLAGVLLCAWATLYLLRVALTRSGWVHISTISTSN